MTIISKEAYALGKMTYGISWREVLPRGCYPSDIDMVFDNRGCVIFGEIESKKTEWRQLNISARLLYQGMIRNGVHCAVLCFHNVKLEDGRVIDTRRDITGFQAMVFELSEFRVSKLIEGNDHWQRFVMAWFRNPDGLRAEIIRHSTILI